MRLVVSSPFGLLVKKVIETRGKTLEQIEAELLHRVHHLEEE